MDNQRIEITQEQLDTAVLTDKCNQVIVEIPYDNEGVTTKGGIIAGFNKSVLYAEGKDAHNADCQEVWGVVYRVPNKLYFNPKDNDSMDWETEIEIQKGDLVWFGIMAGANATELQCGEKLYKLISYQDLIVAKRTRPLDKFLNDCIFDIKTPRCFVIPLNGYILCQTVNCKRISDLDVTSEDKIDPTRAIVRYVGTPNKRYRTEGNVDHLDVRPGDEILLDKYFIIFLERKAYFARFDGDNLYTVVPRRRIAMVINREENT